jgi:hypothetical protein
MAQYIIVGGQTLLGVDADGNYRLLTAPMGTAERRWWSNGFYNKR